MLLQNNTFYWYGTTQKYPPAWISKGINLYSSPDLQRWHFEGQMFDDSQIEEAGVQHPYRIERPKVGALRGFWKCELMITGKLSCLIVC